MLQMLEVCQQDFIALGPLPCRQVDGVAGFAPDALRDGVAVADDAHEVRIGEVGLQPAGAQGIGRRLFQEYRAVQVVELAAPLPFEPLRIGVPRIGFVHADALGQCPQALELAGLEEDVGVMLPLPVHGGDAGMAGQDLLQERRA